MYQPGSIIRASIIHNDDLICEAGALPVPPPLQISAGHTSDLILSDHMVVPMLLRIKARHVAHQPSAHALPTCQAAFLCVLLLPHPLQMPLQTHNISLAAADFTGCQPGSFIALMALLTTPATLSHILLSPLLCIAERAP